MPHGIPNLDPKFLSTIKAYGPDAERELVLILGGTSGMRDSFALTWAQAAADRAERTGLNPQVVQLNTAAVEIPTQDCLAPALSALGTHRALHVVVLTDGSISDLSDTCKAAKELLANPNCRLDAVILSADKKQTPLEKAFRDVVQYCRPGQISARSAPNPLEADQGLFLTINARRLRK